jgi:hypothetical protein
MFRNQWRDKGKDLVWLYHDNSILSSSNETNIRHDLYTIETELVKILHPFERSFVLVQTHAKTNYILMK